MAQQDPKRVVAVLLERHGRTYAGELRIDLAKGAPSALFRWLSATILLSARINAGLAMQAAKALTDRGLTTAQRMARTSWEQRVTVLNRNGYARYDERTATMLGDTATFLVRAYGGDLRRLREAAGRNPNRERELLMQCKGIGAVGAGIFLREAQATWDEAYPYADERAPRVAARLGLGRNAPALAKHVARADFPRLVAALLRADLARDVERVRELAG